MDLKNLKTFIYVAELNSFTRAGNALGYSQSTVSFQIKQLETELNVHLFERVNHTISLTEKGREVLGYAHKMLEFSQDLEKSLSESDAVTGDIKITMADSLCPVFLGKEYKGFCEQYPEIALKIMTASTEEMFRMINQNETDLVFTLDDHIYNNEYRIVGEKRLTAHFVASVDHPLSKKEKVGLEELVKEPFMMTEKGMSYRRILDRKLAAQSLEITPILELSNADEICRLVAENAGFSCLPDYVTHNAVEEGLIKYIEVPGMEVEIWLQLLHHRDKWISPAMEKVMEYCMKTMDHV